MAPLAELSAACPNLRVEVHTSDTGLSLRKNQAEIGLSILQAPPPPPSLAASSSPSASHRLPAAPSKPQSTLVWMRTSPNYGGSPDGRGGWRFHFADVVEPSTMYVVEITAAQVVVATEQLNLRDDNYISPLTTTTSPHPLEA